MSASPTISVVIALYNKADYIRDTLKSVLAQALPPLEVIVVDDGSTDGGAQWVESLGAPGVRVVRQANGGVSRARNLGISEAQGDWIAFLDADDIWHPDYLGTLAGLMASHPQAGLVGTTYRSVGVEQLAGASQWPSMPDHAPVERIDDLPARWLQGTCFFTSSIAVSRALLARQPTLFPAGESAGEDLDLWFRLAEQSPVALSQRPLVLRVWVPGSLSSGPSQEQDLPYLRRMEQRALRGELPPALRRSTLRYVHDGRVTLARELIARSRRGPAWPLLRSSWRHATRHRWAVTLAMLLAPPRVVHQWQTWRTRRRMIL